MATCHRDPRDRSNRGPPCPASAPGRGPDPAVPPDGPQALRVALVVDELQREALAAASEVPFGPSEAVAEGGGLDREHERRDDQRDPEPHDACGRPMVLHDPMLCPVPVEWQSPTGTALRPVRHIPGSTRTRPQSPVVRSRRPHRATALAWTSGVRPRRVTRRGGRCHTGAGALGPSDASTVCAAGAASRSGRHARRSCSRRVRRVAGGLRATATVRRTCDRRCEPAPARDGPDDRVALRARRRLEDQLDGVHDTHRVAMAVAHGFVRIATAPAGDHDPMRADRSVVPGRRAGWPRVRRGTALPDATGTSRVLGGPSSARASGHPWSPTPTCPHWHRARRASVRVDADVRPVSSRRPHGQPGPRASARLARDR